MKTPVPLVDVEWPDESVSFFAGFEMGVMYFRLHTETGPIEATIHIVNMDAMAHLALATGHHPTFGTIHPQQHGLDLVDVSLVRRH